MIFLLSIFLLGSSLALAQTTCDLPDTSGTIGDHNVGGKCTSPNCTVQFAGYTWWTNFHANYNSWYFENSQAWNPAGVTVDENGLKLTEQQADMGDGKTDTWTSAEAVLLKNPDGSAASIGYGEYFVTVKSDTSWDKQDKNLVFGAFTYQRDAGPGLNSKRELDMIELSQWGYDPKKDGACPAGWQNHPVLKKTCSGNAQFALQPWETTPDDIERFSVSSGNLMTLYMNWKASNQPVEFRVYSGEVTQDNISSVTPVKTWTTPASINSQVPDDSNQVGATKCVRFHLNFYRQTALNQNSGIAAAPSDSSPHFVTITKFNYIPHTAISSHKNQMKTKKISALKIK
jgi:hypothetical protein